MKQTHTPRDLFFDQLHDLHSMELQLGESLPKLAALTCDEDLQDFILNHAAQTDRQLTSVDGIFAKHGVVISSDRCKAIAGLIEGGDAHLQAVDDPHTRDLMMIAHCLRVERYEVAAYEITSRIAEALGMRAEAALLGELLAEEEDAVRKLQGFFIPILQSAERSS